VLIDKPPGGAVLLHLLGQHGGVLGRVEHDESRAEAGGERGLRLLDAVFRAGNQGSVTADEMVHGLRKVELADRREHAERVAGQENDVLQVRPDASSGAARRMVSLRWGCTRSGKQPGCSLQQDHRGKKTRFFSLLCLRLNETMCPEIYCYK
jgi:hypothetical protein